MVIEDVKLHHVSFFASVTQNLIVNATKKNISNN